jgi:hypothetical protein
MRLYFSILFLLVIFTILPTQAQEEKLNPLNEDRFLVEAGVFTVSRSFKIRADGEFPNEEIDFNESFGLADTEPTYFLQFAWRFSKRWTVSLQSFGVSASDGAVLEEDVEFEDITFEKGSFVEGGINFQLYRLYFERRVFMRPKHDITVGIGIHGMNIETFIEGEVRTSEGNLEPDRRSVSALIPLPNVGFSYAWFPHHRWMLGADVDWFGLTIDQYSGGLWDVVPKVRFQIIDHFGVGMEYRFFAINAKVDTENWNGKLNLDFKGPSLTLYSNF